MREENESFLTQVYYDMLGMPRIVWYSSGLFWCHILMIYVIYHAERFVQNGEFPYNEKEIRTMNEFITNIAENVTFVLEFLALVAALVAVAVIAEKLLNKRNGNDSKILTTRKVAMIGMFSAVAGIFMILELPMPFAPSFYKIDPSELPVLICGFAFGPVAGVLTEFVKIIIKLFLKPTSTAFVGELANFCVGCSMILPATIIYHAKKMSC